MMKPATKNTAFGKICYLLAITIILFLSSSFWIITSVLTAQVYLLVKSNLGLAPIVSTSKRLLFLFIVIVVSYIYFPAQEGSGIVLGLMMCMKVLAMTLTTFWLMNTEKPESIVAALRKMFLPEMLALSIQTSLSLLAGTGKKKGKGNGKGKNKIKMTFDDIKARKLDWLYDRIDESFAKAKEYISSTNPKLSEKQIHDLTVIVGMVLAIMSLKLLQIMPGLPIAPGQKNLLIIPMLLLASSQTHTRWGGLLVGTTAGIVSVMMGYGKYGFFEVAHMAVPGLLADILLPFLRYQKIVIIKFITALFIGAIIGAGRFAANFLVIVLAGAPFSAFVIYTPMLVSQIVFGALSALVTIAILERKKNN